MRSLVLAALLVFAVRGVAQAAQDSESEWLLKRVLRSGCREGLSELAQLAREQEAAGNAVPGRILALCQEISREAEVADGRPRDLDRDGRAKLVLASTAYGLWTGIAVDVIGQIDDARAAVVPPLLGVGAGLALSLWATKEGGISSGQAWTIITGLDYGTYSGLLWAAAAGADNERVGVGAGLAGGAVGGVVGTLVARSLRPSAGDAEVVRSGGLWGFAAGLFGSILIHTDEGLGERRSWATMAVGMDAGLALGALAASRFALSRNRMLLVDAGTLAGGVAGFGGTFLVMGEPEGGDEARILAGLILAGMAAGMASAIWLTRHLPGEDRGDRSAAPALLAWQAGDGWRLGTPALVPIVTPTPLGGARLTGLTVVLVGGAH